MSSSVTSSSGGPPRVGLPSPTWLKAPLVLTRFPAIAFALGTAALVMGLAASSAPLFLSSSGNEAMRRELANLSERDAGLQIETYGPLVPELFEPGDRALVARLDAIDRLGDPLLTIVGSSTTLTGPRDARIDVRVRLLHREGGVANLVKVSEAPVEGYWLSESVARAVGAHPGKEVELTLGDNTTKLMVAGTYEDFGKRPLSDFWSPLTFELMPVSLNDPPPPPPVIASRKLVFDAGHALFDQATMGWEIPLLDQSLRLEEAQALEAEERRLELDLRNPQSELGSTFEGLNSYFGGPRTHSQFPEAVANVENTVISITGPVNLLALTGRIVALAVLAAAGVFSVQRRRIEIRLLASQGLRPSVLGVRAALESVLPVALGVAAGWGAAVLLVRSVGPTPSVSDGVVAGSLRVALLSGLLGIALLGVVTAVAAKQQNEAESMRLRGLAARVPWEAIVLTLAAASFYEIVTRGEAVVVGSTGAPRIDIFVLLFPILFIAGGSGLAARGLRRVLPALRRLGDRSGSAVYLASRRLAGAPRIALLLVTASTISLGVLVYSAVLVASNEATARAKAHVRVGSDSMVPIASEGRLDEGLPFEATLVARKDDAELQPGDVKVDTLAVDPQTFDDVAFFDPSFASDPLPDLMGRLTPFDGRVLTAIAAGFEEDVADGTAFTTPNYDVALDVVGTASTWPGMSQDRPMLIVRRDALFEAAAASGTSIPERIVVKRELWAKAPLAEVLSALRDSDMIFSPDGAFSAGEILSTPSFLALAWTFEYLQALGIATGLIALIGMVLYLQTRQQAREVSYVLARRMGLRRNAHRSAVAFELGAMLGISLVAGAALAIAASLLVYARLDPLPDVPPEPLFRAPPEVLLVLVPVIAAAALVGAWRVQRKADSVNVAEVLRYAQ